MKTKKEIKDMTKVAFDCGGVRKAKRYLMDLSKEERGQFYIDFLPCNTCAQEVPVLDSFCVLCGANIESVHVHALRVDVGSDRRRLSPNPLKDTGDVLLIKALVLATTNEQTQSEIDCLLDEYANIPARYSNVAFVMATAIFMHEQKHRLDEFMSKLKEEGGQDA